MVRAVSRRRRRRQIAALPRVAGFRRASTIATANQQVRPYSQAKPDLRHGGGMSCVDLKALAGKRYKLGVDLAYYAEYGEHGRVIDPWLLTIPCMHGEIYPHGKETLGFSSNGVGPIRNKLAQLEGVTVLQ